MKLQVLLIEIIDEGVRESETWNEDYFGFNFYLSHWRYFSAELLGATAGAENLDEVLVI